MAILTTNINRKKLFGELASRVTSEELFSIYTEVMKETSHLFKMHRVPRFFEEKITHGDVDIIAIPHSLSWKDEFLHILGDRILQHSFNGQCHSFLYHSDIGKDVHVDVIVVYRRFFFDSMIHYYSFNDQSSVIGVIAKRRMFKYSTLGFYKRIIDSKNNTHYVLLSLNLDEGLIALGYDPMKFHSIRSLDDAVMFVMSSPMFDYNHFMFDNMTQREKRDYKRPNIQYMVNVFRTKSNTSSIEDDDYYIKKHFPHWMDRIQHKIDCSEKSTHMKSMYNGFWMNHHFPHLHGIDLRYALDDMKRHFGFDLSRVSEDEVIQHVQNYLRKLHD